jgi:hypothetical protein
LTVHKLPAMSDYYVYALLCKDDDGPGYVKFGRTQCMSKRFTQIKGSCPIPIRYIATVALPSEAVGKIIEKRLHLHFRSRRVHGEWFRFDFFSPEDKRAFNDGCRHVFETNKTNLRQGTWWEVVDAQRYSAWLDGKRQLFLRKNSVSQIQRRQKNMRRAREYAIYRG